MASLASTADLSPGNATLTSPSATALQNSLFALSKATASTPASLRLPRQADSVSTSSSTLVNMPDDGASHLASSPPSRNRDAHRRRFGPLQRSDYGAGGGDDVSASAPTVRAPTSPVRQTSERYRPKTSPFSSPRKKGAFYREHSTAPAPQLPAFAASRPTKFNDPKPTPRPCPDDCRCSDREVEMGMCACAAGTSGSTTSSSSPPSSDAVPAAISAEEMRARLEGSHASQQGASCDRARIRAAYIAALASSENMLPSSSDTDAEFGDVNGSISRVSASATPRRIQVRTGSASAAASSSKQDYDEATSSDSILGDDADEAGPSGVSYSRISAAGRPSLDKALARTRRRLSQPLASEGSPASKGDQVSDDEPEVRRRKRREERDRLIRQRIEEKRRAKEAAALQTSDSRHNRSSEPLRHESQINADDQGQKADTSADRTARKRGFDEDLSRLHRISHPPSATSIAAFAAQVSPPKVGHSRVRPRVATGDSTPSIAPAEPESSTRDTLGLEIGKPAGRVSAQPNRSPYRPELDLPPLPSASDDSASPSKQLQDGIELLTKKQIERRRRALIEEADDEENEGLLSPPEQPRSSHSSPSPTGFSFAPQRMSTEIGTVPGSPHSPRRNGHRRRRLESEVVSANARLPANSSFEARQRLERALRSPLRNAEEDLEAVQKAAASAAPASGDIPATAADVQAPKSSMLLSADSNTSSGSTSRKSVRFSERTETIESVSPSDSDDEDEDEDDGGEGGEDVAKGDDGGDEEASTSTGTLIASSFASSHSTLHGRGQQIDLDRAMQEMERHEAQTTHDEDPRPLPSMSSALASPSNGPPGTPIRLPPGAFGTPFRLTVPTDLREGTPSFSRHILRLNHKRTLGSDEPTRPRTVSELGNPAAALDHSPSQSHHVQSPMMPGGMRIKALPASRAAAAASSQRRSPPLRPLFGKLNVRRSATAPATDRGLPPSYSAIMPPLPSHSMSHSTSVDGSLEVLQEGNEEEEEEDAEPANDEGQGSNVSGMPTRRGATRHQRVPSHPLQSTPPPSPKRSQPVETVEQAGRPFKRTSLADAVPWAPIEDLGQIASPPDSRSVSPQRDSDAGSDRDSDPARGNGAGALHTSALLSPDSGHPTMDDDSIRVTIKKVMNTLQEKYHPLTTLVRPIEPKDAPGKMPASLARDKAAMQAKLAELKSETAALQSELSAEGKIDLQQSRQMQSAQKRLVTHLEELGLSVKSGSSLFLRGESGIQLRRPRLGVAGSWVLLQVLILWLSLVAMRRGADHLFRCTYYDPFYPHIYDINTDDLGLAFGLRYGLVSLASQDYLKDGPDHGGGDAYSPLWGSLPLPLGEPASYSFLVGKGAASVATGVAGLCLRLVSALARLPLLSLRLVGASQHWAVVLPNANAWDGGIGLATVDLHSWSSLARFLRGVPLRLVCALVKTLEDAVADAAIIGNGSGLSTGRITFPL